MRNSKTQDKSALAESIARFIDDFVRPLSKILMRFGASVYQFDAVSRWSFVHGFFETPEFWRKDAPTVQQGALKTGLARSEVDRLHHLPAPHQAAINYRQNIAARVLSGWVNDAMFAPFKELPIHSPDGPSFNRLVLKYAADANTQAVLDDLMRSGCVVRKENVAALVNQTYGLDLLDEEKLVWAGYMGKHFLETTDFNITHPQSERRLQRAWRQMLVPEEHSEQALELIKDIAVKAGRQIDEELSKLSHPQPQDGVHYAELGIVMYSFKEQQNLQPHMDDNNDQKGDENEEH